MRKEAQQDQTIINTPDHNSSIDASTTQTDDRKLTSKVGVDSPRDGKCREIEIGAEDVAEVYILRRVALYLIKLKQKPCGERMWINQRNLSSLKIHD
jgi:hypothetical protein